MKGTGDFHVLFEIVNGHVLEFNLLGTIDVSGVSQDAGGLAGSGNIWESILQS